MCNIFAIRKNIYPHLICLKFKPFDIADGNIYSFFTVLNLIDVLLNQIGMDNINKIIINLLVYLMKELTSKYR